MISILHDIKLFTTIFHQIKIRLKKLLLSLDPTKPVPNRAAYIPLRNMISKISDKTQKEELLFIMKQNRPDGCNDRHIDNFFNEYALKDKTYQNFAGYTKKDIKFFETHTPKKALWGGKPTKSFVEYIYLKDKFLGPHFEEKEFIDVLRHQFGRP